MDAAQFKDAAATAIDEIVRYYDTIQDRRVISAVEPGYLRKLLPGGPPLEGEAWEAIQQDIESKIVPGLTHWQSPRFMAFFPTSFSYPGVLGELYSAALSAPAFNWICSPAITELETIVLDWLAKLMNLPSCYLSDGEGGGVIQGTASEAIVTVMVAARDKYLRETTAHLFGEEQEDAIALKRGKLVALGSTESHSSTKKAAQIAGVRFRTVAANAKDGFAVTGPELQKVLDECKAKGLEPFYLTATLGTTGTCAIDDFEGIVSTLATHCPPGPGEVWVHVDAAYAGAALVVPEYQHLTASFEKFHSFDVNLHKWLLANFDVSCLYIKKRRDLTEALSVSLSILRNDFTDSGLVTDYRDWSIAFGRRFRALKIWFVMRTYGIKGLQEHIRKHIKLGETFSSLLKGRKDLFQIVAGPSFALTVFSILPRNAESKDAANAITKSVHDAMLSSGEFYLTSVVVDGTYALRVVSANTLAEEQYIHEVFNVLVATAERIRSGETTTSSPETEKGDQSSKSVA